ncbi:MAG: hypothetical protein AB8B95_11480 [Pseudohongiellaceae bacterium]
MNWDALGAIGEIIGAIAVIATLVYLSIQLRQNTQAVRSSALDSSISALSVIRDRILSDKEIAELYISGCEDPESLDSADLTRYRMLLTNILLAIMNLYENHKHAGLSESFWTNIKPNVQRTFSSKGGNWFWNEYRHEFENEFALVIDQIIEN